MLARVVLLVLLVLAGGIWAQGRGGRRRTSQLEIGELFVPFDVSRNRAIGRNEFEAAWHHFDANGDGRVSPDELAGRSPETFTKIDRNGDGGLSRAELQRVAKQMVRIPQPSASLPDAASPIPPAPAPRANPTTPEKVVLGKMLFWEQQLSSSNDVACGTCHSPRHGGADPRLGRHPGRDGKLDTEDDVFGSPGVASRDRMSMRAETAPQELVTPRASPAFLGTLHAPRLFWDGRAGSVFREPNTRRILLGSDAALENQALQPILNRTEMSHERRGWRDVTRKLEAVIPLARATKVPGDVIAALGSAPTYPKLFARAFGNDTITPARIAYAIASYERSLVPDRTPFDRFIAGDNSAMTPLQIRGWRVFRQSACAVCHPPPFFTDHTFRNIGVRPTVEDIGRAEITGLTRDRGRFKVPSLRNVGLKRRFMHNGRLASLGAVLDHYARRGRRLDSDVDPLLQRGIFLRGERRALIDFLSRALTDPRARAATGPFSHPTLAANEK